MVQEICVKTQLKYRFYRIIPIIILLIGILLSGNTIYYYSKGIAAQILLERAWKKSGESKSGVIPWGWADIHPIAKLKIDSINLSKIVLNNISGEALAFGVGHLPSSVQPGENGNIVISGHRDSHFRKLNGIKKGDLVVLESIASVQNFYVTEIIITDKNDVSWIYDTDENILTLITCYPYNFIGLAEKRFIVRGKYKK